MKAKVTFILTVLFFITVNLFAEEYSKDYLIMMNPQLAQNENQEKESSLIKDTTINEYMTTSKKRFFQSFFVPGWGQYSNGGTVNKIKAAVFLGLEAFFIYMAYDYNKKGSDKEDEYKAFADAYFDSTKYLAWVQAYKPVYWNVNRFDEDSLPEFFTHNWHDEDEQQYYEMIGKYKQFWVGWRDARLSDSSYTYYPNGKQWNIGDPIAYGEHFYSSRMALEYMDMRAESNDFFKKSQNFVYFIFLNHIASAIEAAWTAHKIDKKIEDAVGLKNSNIDLALYPDRYSRSGFSTYLRFKANF